MKKEINVREWQKNFIAGAYDSIDFDTQCKAGWYDWFCHDASLARKTKRMGQIIKQVKDSGKIDIDTMYVWFKNNCPIVGKLYDDIRFADIETGAVQFTIQIGDERNLTRYCVYGAKNDFATPLFETDFSRELVKWLNEKWDN